MRLITTTITTTLFCGIRIGPGLYVVLRKTPRNRHRLPRPDVRMNALYRFLILTMNSPRWQLGSPVAVSLLCSAAIGAQYVSGKVVRDTLFLDVFDGKTAL